MRIDAVQLRKKLRKRRRVRHSSNPPLVQVNEAARAWIQSIVEKDWPDLILLTDDV